MSSRKGLNDLVTDYRTALGHVHDAAQVLEDASVFISAAGSAFTRESVRHIDQLSSIYVEINKTTGRLREVPPDDHHQ
jgi:hypothetical protein